MNIEHMIHLLGDDADLLTMNDEWLEEERKSLASELDEIGQQLQAVIYAQIIKKRLQQTNKVALQTIEKNEKGEISDISLTVLPLPDAIKRLKNGDVLDTINSAAQIIGWTADGYDVVSSAKLR